MASEALAYAHAATVDIHIHHAQRVRIGLVATHVQCAARIPRHRSGIGDIRGHGIDAMTQSLGLVDMPQRKIVIARAIMAQRHGAEGAHINVVARDVATLHRLMCHHHHGLARDVLACDVVQQSLNSRLALAGHEGQRHDIARTQAHDVMLHPGIDGRHDGRQGSTHEPNARKLPHPVVRLQPRGRVVIAGHDDDGHRRHRTAQSNEAVGESLPRSC